MNLRELVGRSINSSDLETHEHESAIDRIGALGRATALSSALWRLGPGGDTTSTGSALKHLLRKAQRRTKVYKGHKDFKMLNRICYMVLSEWLKPQCRTCDGRAQIENNQLTVICHICGGTGLHRYSDMERCHQLDIEPVAYRRFEKIVADVWLCLSGADAGAIYTCRQQLERS